MIYDVFGGTLNLAQLQLQKIVGLQITLTQTQIQVKITPKQRQQYVQHIDIK